MERQREWDWMAFKCLQEADELMKKDLTPESTEKINRLISQALGAQGGAINNEYLRTEHERNVKEIRQAIWSILDVQSGIRLRFNLMLVLSGILVALSMVSLLLL